MFLEKSKFKKPKKKNFFLNLLIFFFFLCAAQKVGKQGKTCAAHKVGVALSLNLSFLFAKKVGKQALLNTKNQFSKTKIKTTPHRVFFGGALLLKKQFIFNLPYFDLMASAVAHECQ